MSALPIIDTATSMAGTLAKPSFKMNGASDHVGSLSGVSPTTGDSLRKQRVDDSRTLRSIGGGPVNSEVGEAAKRYRRKRNAFHSRQKRVRKKVKEAQLLDAHHRLKERNRSLKHEQCRLEQLVERAVLQIRTLDLQAATVPTRRSIMLENALVASQERLSALAHQEALFGQNTPPNIFQHQLHPGLFPFNTVPLQPQTSPRLYAGVSSSEFLNSYFGNSVIAGTGANQLRMASISPILQNNYHSAAFVGHQVQPVHPAPQRNDAVANFIYGL